MRVFFRATQGHCSDRGETGLFNLLLGRNGFMWPTSQRGLDAGINKQCWTCQRGRRTGRKLAHGAAIVASTPKVLSTAYKGREEVCKWNVMSCLSQTPVLTQGKYPSSENPKPKKLQLSDVQQWCYKWKTDRLKTAYKFSSRLCVHALCI